MSNKPGRFHARQVLLVERAKHNMKHTKTPAATLNSSHPHLRTLNRSLRSIVTVEPRPIDHTPSILGTTDSTTSRDIGPSTWADCIVCMMMYPLFVACCLLVWIKYEMPEYDAYVFYVAGRRWVHHCRRDGQKVGTRKRITGMHWFISVLRTPFMVVNLCCGPIKWLIRDNDKKRAAFKSGERLKRPCPFTTTFVVCIHRIGLIFYTAIGIHLVILRLLRKRFYELRDVWFAMRLAWWGAVTKRIHDNDMPVSQGGQCQFENEG